jgi:hypothetical protein
MPRPSSHPFDALIERFAQALAARLGTRLAAPKSAATAGSRGPSKLRGRRLDMRCRYPGCKNKSKGPRFRFMCEEHRRLPKKQQEAALEKWKAKHG